MTAHDLTVWHDAFRAGAIFGSLIGVVLGAAGWWAGQQLRTRRAARRARGDRLLAELVERDLICRSGLIWPALYDQDEDRRWQR